MMTTGIGYPMGVQSNQSSASMTNSNQMTNSNFSSGNINTSMSFGNQNSINTSFTNTFPNSAGSFNQFSPASQPSPFDNNTSTFFPTNSFNTAPVQTSQFPPQTMSTQISTGVNNNSFDLFAPHPSVSALPSNNNNSSNTNHMNSFNNFDPFGSNFTPSNTTPLASSQSSFFPPSTSTSSTAMDPFGSSTFTTSTANTTTSNAAKNDFDLFFSNPSSTSATSNNTGFGNQNQFSSNTSNNNDFDFDFFSNTPPPAPQVSN
jgi:hypothetical protein